LCLDLVYLTCGDKAKLKITAQYSKITELLPDRAAVEEAARMFKYKCLINAGDWFVASGSENEDCFRK
jgi:hypothetical protein